MSSGGRKRVVLLSVVLCQSLWKSGWLWLLLPRGKLFLSPTLQTWSIGISPWLLMAAGMANQMLPSLFLQRSHPAVFLPYGGACTECHKALYLAKQRMAVWCPEWCSASAVLTWSSEESHERSSTARCSHHLLHVHFFSLCGMSL